MLISPGTHLCARWRGSWRPYCPSWLASCRRIASMVWKASCRLGIRRSDMQPALRRAEPGPGLFASRGEDDTRYDEHVGRQARAQAMTGRVIRCPIADPLETALINKPADERRGTGRSASQLGGACGHGSEEPLLAACLNDDVVPSFGNAE
jgi:hypothetical protein